MLCNENSTADQSVEIETTDALIIVDLQNDFCPPEGSLAVPEGTEIIPAINGLVNRFPLTIVTQDWHPSNHYSFEKQGGNWPEHCVKGQWGAKLHPKLNQEQIDHFLKKGQEPNLENDYSGFSATDQTGRRLAQLLNDQNIERIFLSGLALDYCVQATALEGLNNDFQVYLLSDCTRPVDEQKGEQAKEKIARKGGSIITSTDIKFS